MNKPTTFLNSSVGRKLIMALTGFFLFSFLIVHLYLNLFLLKQDQGLTFDAYAEFMATYPLVRPLEIGLFAGFLLHAALGVTLWWGNRAVRNRRYRVIRSADTSSVASRLAFWSGLGVALFLVLHVNAFFVPSRFFPDGRTMYEYVAEAFRSPLVVGFYVAAMAVLGYHLRHAFQSAFQTLGIRTARYQGWIDATGIVFWLLIPLGFAAIPVYFLLAH